MKYDRYYIIPFKIIICPTSLSKSLIFGICKLSLDDFQRSFLFKRRHISNFISINCSKILLFISKSMCTQHVKRVPYTLFYFKFSIMNDGKKILDTIIHIVADVTP